MAPHYKKCKFPAALWVWLQLEPMRQKVKQSILNISFVSLINLKVNVGREIQVLRLTALSRHHHGLFDLLQRLQPLVCYRWLHKLADIQHLSVWSCRHFAIHPSTWRMAHEDLEAALLRLFETALLWIRLTSSTTWAPEHSIQGYRLSSLTLIVWPPARTLTILVSAASSNCSSISSYAVADIK